MIKRLKCVLYEKGYMKPNEFIDKIVYLKYTKLNPYKLPAYRIKSIESDIIDYVNTLATFLEINTYTELLPVKVVTEDTVQNMNIHSWFTNNNHIIDDVDSTLDTWFDLIIEIHAIFIQCTNNVSNTVSQRNSILLRPYIINIESIIDVLLAIK